MLLRIFSSLPSLTIKLFAVSSFLFFVNQTVYAQPIITNFNPDNGPVNSNITITGNGFSNTAANNTVYFGSVKATVLSSTSSALTVKVPVGCNNKPLSVTVNGLTAYSSKPFIITFAGGSTLYNNSFTPRTDISTMPNLRNAITADMNGDGKTDIINRRGTTLTIFKNSSNASVISFSDTSNFEIIVGFDNSLATADMDGDGRLDVVLYNSGTISVLKNTSANGVLSFASRIDFPASTDSYQIVVADIDNDGRPDIINQGFSQISAIRNTTLNGAINFGTEISIAPAGNYNSGLAVADINSNGKPDIITLNNSPSNVVVFNNNSSQGNISFASALYFPCNGGTVSVTAGNLDNDSLPDIAVTRNANQKVILLKNISVANSISFDPAQEIELGHNGWSVEIADMNGDGKQDIICTSDDAFGKLSIFKNNSTNTFSFAPYFDYASPYSAIHSLAIADLTNDGRLDILTTSNINNFNYGMTVYPNKMGDPLTISSLTPAAASIGETVSISGTNLENVTSVNFGGTPAASFTVVSDVLIKAVVGNGTSGIVAVAGPTGNASVPGFVYKPSVSVASFAPRSGPVGQRVKISGSNFSSVPSENIVYFGTAKAQIISASSNELYVKVPAAATFQPISVTTNNLTAWSKHPFNVTFPNGKIDSSTFKNILNVEYPDDDFSDVVVADIDADGRQDIVANCHKGWSSSYIDSFAIYRNTSANGVISFATRVAFKTTKIAGNFGIGDFDGDGLLDIAVINNTSLGGSGAVNIFKNYSSNGNISFFFYQNYPLGGSPSRMAIGDLDGDGKADIVVNDVGGGFPLYILRNTSSATDISFNIEPSLAARGNERSKCFIYDFDNDGKADIVKSGGIFDSTFSIYKNNSSPGFINMAPKIDYYVGYAIRGFAVADVNGDDKFDIVTSDFFSKFSVFENLSSQGSFSFAPKKDFPGPYIEELKFSDIDGDGRADLVSVGGNDNFSVAKNTSTLDSINFASRVSYTAHHYPDPNPIELSIGDLDGDGKPDVANVNRFDMGVLENQNSFQKMLCNNSGGIIYSNITGVTYQWQVNTGSSFNYINNDSHYSGVLSPQLTLSSIPSSWSGYIYRCVVNSKYSREVVLQFQNQWTGAVNSAWENPGNWSCGSVPDIYTDVVISTGNVVVNSNVSVRSLTIDANASFTVLTPFTITVTH